MSEPTPPPTAPGTTPDTSSAPTLALTGVRVFDGLAAELTEATVVVADGRVADLLPPGARVDADVVLAGTTADGTPRTLAPGLIDAHLHAYGVALDGLVIESLPLSYLAHLGARRLGGALERGFTTVRDVAGGDAGLARAVREGLVAAPRYLWTGAALSQTGGHGDPRSADHDVDVCCAHTTEVVDGVDALRVAVRDRLRRGAHAIKIMTSGGVMSPTDPLRVPQYAPDEIRAVCDEADRRGTYVTAHAYSPEAIVHSVENGVRCIEHANLLDATTAALMAAHDVAMVPTLAAYDAIGRRGTEVGLLPVSRAKNDEVLDAGQRAIEIAVDAGLRIGFGTDLMGDLDDEQLVGLRLQHEVLGAYGTLRAATSTNADILRRPDLGRIAVGLPADLLLLDGDPFEQPEVLWRETGRTVVQAGRVVATTSAG